MNTFSATRIRSLLFVAVLGISAAATAHAQGPSLRVVVPFGFENGSQHLPAGRYTITMDGPSFMQIRGDSKSALTMAQPEENSRPSQTSKLVFHRYGQRYFLRQVWVAGSQTHLECRKSTAEKQLQVAGNTAASNGEEVALLETPR